MGDEFSMEDVLIILQRRFWYFVIPAVLVAVLGIAIIMLMPAKYMAEGTILVESQQIPTEYIRSSNTAYAQERIQTIRQRVMTRERVLKIANKYSVFERGSGLNESERAALMRQRVNLSLITVDKNRRAPGDGTIAFKVSYTDPDPKKAFQVANEFMTLFLSEDVRARTTGASNTTEFFEIEAGKLRERVAALESALSDFKVQNADALPEHLNLHLDLLERATNDYNTSQSTITELDEQIRFLETQLISGSSAGSSLSADLSRLESELSLLRATYHDSYPEVKAKRDEIASLKRRMLPSAAIQRLRQELNEADKALSATENTDPRDEILIAEAEQQVETARNALSERISQESRSGSTDIVGVQIENRLAVINNRVRMLERQGRSTQAQIADYKERIARTPTVERDLSALTRDYDNLFREYQDIQAKQQDAQLAENLEANQQAEKFSILEPAFRPDKPTSPDRPKLMILALFAALAAGGGVAGVFEILFATVRGRDHISSIVDEHPIAVIPFIHGDDKKRSPITLFQSRKNGSKIAKKAA